MFKSFISCSKWILFCIVLSLPTAALFGQDKVVIVRHGSTPEGDIIRARADAVLLLKQAQLTGEKAYAQRLENLIRECDVVYKQFSTRSEIRKEALANKYDRLFDIIKFNQQLADLRSELEQKAVMKHTRIGDLTDEMNHLLETFTRQSLKVDGIPVMKTELTSEQLDAIFLTDGSNTFSGKTGKTRLAAFKWPFLIQRKEFQEERDEFEKLCDQAVNEIAEKNSPSSDTICDLLKQADAIDKKLDSLPLSDSSNVRAVETKWRKEAKTFVRELIRTLGDSSKLDSEKLSKYVFCGKTLGELIDHLNSNGLRFSQPNEQDANLYASIFFIMRYAYQEHEKPQDNVSSGTKTENAASNTPPPIKRHKSGTKGQTKGHVIRPALSGDKFFVGTWLVEGRKRPFTMTLRDDFTATKSNTGGHGKWAFVNGEAQITWNDGWRDSFRHEAKSVRKYGFTPGLTFKSKPSSTSSAERQAEDKNEPKKTMH